MFADTQINKPWLFQKYSKWAVLRKAAFEMKNMMLYAPRHFSYFVPKYYNTGCSPMMPYFSHKLKQPLHRQLLLSKARFFSHQRFPAGGTLHPRWVDDLFNTCSFWLSCCIKPIFFCDLYLCQCSILSPSPSRILDFLSDSFCLNNIIFVAKS